MVVSAKPNPDRQRWCHFTMTVSFAINACLENENLFQCNWYIGGQLEHNTNFIFDYAWFHSWERLGESRKLCPGELSQAGLHKTHKHTSNIYHLPQFTHVIMSQTHAHLRLPLPIQLQITSLHHSTIVHKLQNFWHCFHKQISGLFQGKMPYSL